MTTSRIPEFTGNVRAWATAMHAVNLAFHLDDDPATVIHGGGDRTFTEAEAVEVALIVSRFDCDQRELYYDTLLTLDETEAGK